MKQLLRSTVAVTIFGLLLVTIQHAASKPAIFHLNEPHFIGIAGVELGGESQNCDEFSSYGLSFNLTAPCACNAIKYDIPENIANFTTRHAAFSVSIQCSNSDVASIGSIWEKILPALPVPFSAAFNITSLSVSYNVTLQGIKNSDSWPWTTLFAKPFVARNMVEGTVHRLVLDGCSGLIVNGASNIQLMAPQFRTLAKVVVANDRSIQALPTDSVTVVAPTDANSKPSIKIHFMNTAINLVAGDALAQLGQKRNITSFSIRDSELTSIPFGLLIDSLDSMKKLNLSGNHISSADQPAGVFLRQINKLDLSRNAIGAITDNALWNNFLSMELGAPALIDLHHNQIVAVSDGGFKPYTSSAKIGPASIDLSQNKLSAIPTFVRNLNTNVALNVSINQISTIGRHQFTDQWLAAQPTDANVSSIFAGNQLQCNKKDLGWFACYIQHQLKSIDATPTPALMCAGGNITTTAWVQSVLSGDGTCHYYFPLDDIFQDVTTNPPPVTPTTTAAPPVIPTQACDYYKNSGLDFTTQIRWPCRCVELVSVDLPCSNCSRPSCVTSQEAVFVLNVECAGGDTARVQSSWQNLKYDLPTAFASQFNANKLRVYHAITLIDIVVNTDAWTGQSTTWNDLLNNTVLPTSDTSVSSIETIRFVGETLNDGQGGKTLSLVLGGRAFSALDSISIINATWLTNLPANFTTITSADKNIAPCANEYVNIVIDNTSLATVHDQAFLALTPMKRVPDIAITNSKLASIPFKALSPFNATDRLDLSHNLITSVEATGAVPYISGDIVLSYNQLVDLTDRAFWNNFTASTADANVTDSPPTAIVLAHNEISAISSGAFKVYATNVSDDTTGIDLSNNDLSDISKSNFPSLNDTVKVKVAANKFTVINRGDFNETAWTNGALVPHDFADNLFDCSNPSLNWFACWAVHIVANPEDDISYLQCKDPKHAGQTLHNLVFEKLDDTGVCHNFFPNDTQFEAVYQCDYYANLGLDFSQFHAPCTCMSISSAATDLINQNASITVQLSCQQGDTTTLGKSWSAGMQTPVTTAFAAQYNVSTLEINYKIVLEKITATPTSQWSDVLNLPINADSNTTRTTVNVRQITFDGCDFLLASTTNQFRLNFASNIFSLLNTVKVLNTPTLVELPKNCIIVPVSELDQNFTIVFDNTNIRTVDSFAFEQLATDGKTNGGGRKQVDLAITNGALTDIPVDALKDFKIIRSLYLSGNRINNVDFKQRATPSFAPAISFILDLSNNQITQLNDPYWNHIANGAAPPTALLLDDNQIAMVNNSAFDGYRTNSDAQFISLMNNALPGVPAALQVLPTKTQVNLVANKITKIVQTDLSQAMQDTASASMFVDNPYKCTDDLVWFACWAQKSTQSLTPILNLQCTTSTLIIVVRESLTEIVLNEMGKCHDFFPNEPMFFGGSTTPAPTTPPPPSSAATFSVSLVLMTILAVFSFSIKI